MNSRQRVEAALNHQQPDRVPLDLGGNAGHGHARQFASTSSARPWGWTSRARRSRCIEPYQMLGEIAPDLQDALGVDVVGLGGPNTMFGFREQGLEAVDHFRRHAGAGAGRLQHRSRAERRHPHVSRGRQVGAAERPDAQGRVLLRLDHPPGADRRRQAERRGQPGGVRPGLRRDAAILRHARPTGCGARAIGRSWPTSAARPSATSPWCPAPG